MKLASWNVRGMNSAEKHAIIKVVIKTVNAEFLFVQETKMEVINVKVACSISAFPDGNYVFCSFGCCF